MTFDEILDACIARLERGESLGTVLTAYPEHANDLAPLLEVALALRDARAVALPTATFTEGRERLSVALRTRDALDPSSTVVSFSPNGHHAPHADPPGGARRGSPFLLRLVASIALLVTLGLGSIGAVRAGSDSLPGSPLYPVKRADEAVRGLFATSTEERAAWHANRTARRCQEAWILTQQGGDVAPTLLAEAEREADLTLERSAAMTEAERIAFITGWLDELERLEAEQQAAGLEDTPAYRLLDAIIHDASEHLPPGSWHNENYDLAPSSDTDGGDGGWPAYEP